MKIAAASRAELRYACAMRHLIPFLIAWLVLAPLHSARAAESPNLTVLVEDSLLLPLSEITRIYAKEKGVSLTVIRLRDGDPAHALEQGFDAHILLSADPTLVQRLAQRGLIDVFGTRSFARTQLALVAPYRMKHKLALAQRISFAALLFSQPELPVYTNDPSTPGGLRAQALLDGREFSHELASRMVVKPSFADIIAALQKQDAFALMLAPNAVAEPEIALLSLLPENTSPPVRYDAVVLASDAMEPSRAFTKFLLSDAAQAVFAKYGFQPARDED